VWVKISGQPWWPAQVAHLDPRSCRVPPATFWINRETPSNARSSIPNEPHRRSAQRQPPRTTRSAFVSATISCASQVANQTCPIGRFCMLVRHMPEIWHSWSPRRMQLLSLGLAAPGSKTRTTRSSPTCRTQQRSRRPTCRRRVRREWTSCGSPHPAPPRPAPPRPAPPRPAPPNCSVWSRGPLLCARGARPWTRTHRSAVSATGGAAAARTR
jgi:hypothetical protein